MVMLGNGTDPNVLESAGIYRANLIVVVTGADETNLVICSLARLEFKVPQIISRVNNPKNAWLYTPEMGVDIAINQAELLGHLIIEQLSLGDMMRLLKLRKSSYWLVEENVAAESTVQGKPVRDLKLPPHCLLVAVIRKGELILPRGDTILDQDDEVLALVHSSEVPNLADILGPIK
jgi:trk system potassium uptake protein TrkA